MDTNVKESSPQNYDTKLKGWVEKEKAAVEFINSIGRLIYDKGIELVLFRSHLVDKSISQILQLHKYTKEINEKDISIYDTNELAGNLLKMDLAPSKLDVGKLADEWLETKEKYQSQSDFLNEKLADYVQSNAKSIQPKDVVLYGFGRIGRIATRELIKQAGKGQQLRLRAIVTRGDSNEEIKKRASLLRMDSIHGAFPGTIEEDYDNKALIINGQIVKMIVSSSPESIDYTTYGINDALLIDSSGAFKDKEALSRHLQAKGVEKVLLTAPGKEIPNIVYGINSDDIDLENDKILSAASCTTNAIVPILDVVQNKLGIIKGHIETVHAYTNDQNLQDNMHKKARRGRSAAINIVITETGAGKAVVKVIPELKGKLTANAVRVPVPNGSLAILSLTVDKETSIEDVNKIFREASLKGNLINQIYYKYDEDLVSSDIVGNECCSVFDSKATIVSNDKKNIVLYIWYDNEFGYTKQVIRLAKYFAKVRRLIYY